jgi:peptidyl-prolyl cis-trans isomerase SurA
MATKYRYALIVAAGIVIPMIASAQTLIDRIVAVVDKEIITESELNDRVALVAMQNRVDPDQPGLRKQVLDALVTEKLILAQALIDSIEVTDGEVTRALDQQVANFVRQVGSEQRVEKMYGKSIARIKREYRSEIRDQLLVQKIRQQREGSVSVSPHEVQTFFETYRDSLPQVPEEFELSHIYIVPKPDTAVEATTRRFAQSILDSIRAGGDFAEFAKRYSEDATAANGGDLGWAKRGDYVREFEEAVFSLKEGEISGIVKTQFGFHIIQLLARRGESVHVRHILIKIPKGAASDSAAVQELRGIRERALKGEPFAELARKYSEDPDTKSVGGDLGELTADQLQPDFASQIKEMKPGEISQPLRTAVGSSYGFHIIWMRKRTPAHAMNLHDDYDRIEQLALYVKRNKLNAQWIEELKKTIYVDIRL